MIQPLKVITDPFIQNTPSNLTATDRQFEPLNATVKPDLCQTNRKIT